MVNEEVRTIVLMLSYDVLHEQGYKLTISIATHAYETRQLTHNRGTYT